MAGPRPHGCPTPRDCPARPISSTPHDAGPWWASCPDGRRPVSCLLRLRRVASHLLAVHLLRRRRFCVRGSTAARSATALASTWGVGRDCCRRPRTAVGRGHVVSLAMGRGPPAAGGLMLGARAGALARRARFAPILLDLFGSARCSQQLGELLMTARTIARARLRRTRGMPQPLPNPQGTLLVDACSVCQWSGMVSEAFTHALAADILLCGRPVTTLCHTSGCESLRWASGCATARLGREMSSHA